MFRPVGLRRGWDEDYFGSYGIRAKQAYKKLYRKLNGNKFSFSKSSSFQSICEQDLRQDLFQTLVKSHCKYSAYSITEASGICSLAHYGQEQLKNVSISLCALQTPIQKNSEHIKETFVSGSFKTDISHTALMLTNGIPMISSYW
ncbi:hypothetical protein X798_05515 [Onchocerca flexuosa]|uniref:Uncharacterized protein n=1 Tax=Onchocerca flexuosa TaxID=387005 RepID=A0A238BQ08_9BILA|nr:hypothetical protein X798_05515 [Onchocerca flexuosa]